MNTASATAANQFVLVDDRDIMKEQHGSQMYWCGTAWSTDLDRAIVYGSIEAAELQKKAWIARHEQAWRDISRGFTPPAGINPPQCIGHVATVHNKAAIQGSGRVFYAAFRGAYDSALACGIDKASSRDIARAAGKAAARAAFPLGTVAAPGVAA